MQPPPPQVAPTIVPPNAPKPKSRSPLMIVASLAAAALGFAAVRTALPMLVGKAPSGVTTNGKSLSRDEAREGLKEIAEMSRGARAGDPSTLNTAAEPKTELGRNFKRLALKSQGVEKAYADALGGATVADLLEAKNLASKPAREATRARLAKLGTASATYFADTRGVSDELFRLIAGANGERIPNAPALEAEIAANDKGMTNLLAIAGKMLDLADEAKPTLQGSSAVFRTSAQVARYNAIVSEFNTAAQEFQTASAKALRDRQENLNRALGKIDGGAL